MSSTIDLHDMRVLNAALREAVDFVHPEGWDRPATLFAIVPTALIADAVDLDDADSVVSLVVQDDLPDHLPPGSVELTEYIQTIRWPDAVLGAILVQEIRFLNTAGAAEPAPDAEPQDARLYSGVLCDEDGSGAERSLLQLRPTEADLADDPFADDRVALLGGDDIAPEVLTILRSTFLEDQPGGLGL